MPKNQEQIVHVYFKGIKFRMQDATIEKTLSVNIKRNSATRTVRFTNSSNKNRETPGELTFHQWQHLKIKPSTEIISDIENNVGKLITYLTLRDSFAKLVATKRPYQCSIQKDGIEGTSEIISYDFKREYLDQNLCVSHLSSIETFILVITSKQLKAESVSAQQASKAVFINEFMIPQWQYRNLEWTPQLTIENVLDYMDGLMSRFIILDLKISMKKLEESSEEKHIFVEIWIKVVKKRAIGNPKSIGLYNSEYPKITFEKSD